MIVEKQNLAYSFPEYKSPAQAGLFVSRIAKSKVLEQSERFLLLSRVKNTHRKAGIFLFRRPAYQKFYLEEACPYL